MVDIDFSKLDFCSIEIRNDLQLAREQIVRPILARIADLGYCSQDQFAIRLALEEAISNAYRHGNKCEPDRSITARWAIDNTCAVIYVSDGGSGFNPACVPDPRSAENREKPSGRGIMLMKAYMTEMHFNKQGNELCLIKIRKAKPPKF
jgi:serine/threonine-protein kinase RsbW